MEPVISLYRWGFHKGHSTEQALVRLIESWRESLNKGGYAGAILMDLSKALDCLDHEFLINGIFFFMSGTELCNYADDTTIFVCDSDVNCVQHTS